MTAMNINIKRFGLSLAVMVPAIVWASAHEDTSEQALRYVCSEFSQAQMRECLAEKAATSEKALKQNEIRAHDAISKWDEHANYIRIAQEKLARSTEAFERFRRSQCEFSSSLAGGAAGNAHETMRLSCVAALNGQRIESLKNAVSDLPRK
jgi:antitoxin component of MazEF toxin-antitoxin module